MHCPRALRHGLRSLAAASSRRSYITDADVESARRYCQTRLQKNDYDAHLIRRFVPEAVRDTYTALRALNLELVHLPEMVSNPLIGTMRIRFWKDSIDHTFAGNPPREPICILLHRGLSDLDRRSAAGGSGGVSVGVGVGVGGGGGGGGVGGGGGGAGAATRSSIKFWISRLVRAREKHMDNRPFASIAALEDHAENTYSTIMYATLAAMPMRSLHVDHLASHIGKACGIVAMLRGVPILAAPPAAASSSSLSTTTTTTKGGQQKAPGSPAVREPSLLLPLDVMAEEGVKEEEVFRQGPQAPGLQDAVFRIATRANDHLITAREMLKRLQAGEDPGHEFEHQGEGEHFYDGAEADAARDVRRGFGVLLEAVPAALWLRALEQANFDPFAVRSGGWRLPWGIWQALSKQRI